VENSSSRGEERRGEELPGNAQRTVVAIVRNVW